jgi:arylsulfatase A-like enzyme
MKYRIAAVVGALILVVAYGVTRLVPPPSVPNVVLIIADDFGIDASPCYAVGAEKPTMPNLERLCAEGIVFDNVWVNPLCTPTRATLVSAQYGFRTGVRQNRQPLADTTRTLFDVLREEVPRPYGNAVIGKWHVSGHEPDPAAPAAYGVEHFAGLTTGALSSYASWDITENGTTRHTSAYATTLLTDKAIEWADAQQEPWLLWLAYNAPHRPYHVPPANLLSSVPADADRDARAKFFAMAEALDHEIGRFLDSLDAATRANTTIIFIGDNGTDPGVIQPPFGADRGKTSLYEGGVRVPLVVAGHGVTRAGDREDALVNGVDVSATIAELAGSGDSELGDGVSFLDALSDASFDGRDFIYTDGPNRTLSGYNPGWAIRDARYKLIQYDSGERRLYDMSVDPWEQDDLLTSSSDPEVDDIVESLTRLREELVRTSP